MRNTLYSMLSPSADLPYLYLCSNMIMRTNVPVGVDAKHSFRAVGCSAKVTQVEMNAVKIEREGDVEFVILGGYVQWLETC